MKNDSDGVLTGAKVTDNLSDVINHASDPFAITPSGGSASFASPTLTWNLPTLQPGDSATLTYKVTIDADALGIRIRNVATPDKSGDCINACTTTHEIGRASCRERVYVLV